MLKIKVEGEEFFNDESGTFEVLQGFEIELEHSLVSLSKWESKYQKPFLSSTEKIPEEIFGYIEAMVMTTEFDSTFIFRLSHKDLEEINAYIDSKQTATTFGATTNSRSRPEIITSELIYYWMIAFNVPFECQHWHLNRLLTLIRICSIKNAKPTKMSKHEVAARNRELNALRRSQLSTSG